MPHLKEKGKTKSEKSYSLFKRYAGEGLSITKAFYSPPSLDYVA